MNMFLVVGCGHPDRGDDAAGLLVARRLTELGVPAREQSGEALALVEAWSGAEQVIVLDAVVTGAPPGTVAAWDGRTAPVVRETFRGSSHAFGVAEAIELARVLGRLPPSLTIYGIEGRQFEIGAKPSPEVLAAVERVAHEIAERYHGGRGDET